MTSRQGLTRRSFLAGLGATGVGVALGGAFGVAGARSVTTTEYRIGTGESSLRIGVLTDLHLGRVSDFEREVAERLSALRPDVVVLVGDTVDQREGLARLPGFLELLPDLPTFATMGNWEYWGEVPEPELRRAFADHRIELLVNAWAELPDGRRIFGLDDLVAGRPRLEPNRGSGPALLLSHCPAFRDRPEPGLATFDAMISGHTHGGQVRLGGWAPVTPPGSAEYVVGRYDGGPIELIVSAGIGTSVLPIRIGADPEVVLVDWRAP